jgi:hypothetical protein
VIHEITTDVPLPIRMREERRSAPRFPLRLACSYRVFNRHGVVASGKGQTADISARGLFVSGSDLDHEGLRIDVAVHWPTNFVTLAVRGRIVRLEDSGAGVQVMRHSFVPKDQKRQPVASSVK